MILHCHWSEFCSRNTDISATSDRILIRLDQLLKVSFHTPFHFSFVSPFKQKADMIYIRAQSQVGNIA